VRQLSAKRVEEVRVRVRVRVGVGVRVRDIMSAWWHITKQIGGRHDVL